MIPMRENEIDWIIGSKEIMDIRPKPIFPYSELVIEFMDDFSNLLRKTAGKEYSDLAALAFWCRKGNVCGMRNSGGGLEHCLGRGLIFHITPSNVPVNFAFSFFFGLLSGNANIVRIPSKDYEQINIICDVIKRLFTNGRYKSISERTAFVRYGHEKEITDAFCAIADGRIIWGGNNSINEIRKSMMKPKSVEIVFADRFSFGLLDTEAVNSASDEQINDLAQKFYNDTYLMDQNACSTPHLIVWHGARAECAQKRFWNAVYMEAGKYNLEPVKAVDKYTDMTIMCMRSDVEISGIEQKDNLLYILNIKKIPKEIDRLRGRFGMFMQCRVDSIDELTPYITESVQSLLYYGMDKNELMSWVLENNLMGIDRIVPFGRSLDMNVFWDGYDIIRQLCRKIIFD